jgi:hypothetical protein
VLFRKIDADHPTVLLDEIDAIFGDKTGNTEGIRSLFSPDPPMARVDSAVGTRKQVPF